MVLTQSDDFKTTIEAILKDGLRMNVIDATFNSLFYLVTNPEQQIETVMLPGGNIIDQRKQQREYKAFADKEDYKKLIKLIFELKQIPNWFNLLQSVEIIRSSKMSEIRLVENLGEKASC